MDSGANNTDRAAAVKALVVTAEAPLDLRSQPGRLQLATLMGAAASGASIVLAVVAVGGLSFLGGTAATFGIIYTVARGIKDLMVPGARRRRSSEQAVDVYFKGVQHRRWDAALAALAPYARTRVVFVPEVEELKSVARAITRANLGELKDYWSGIACSGMSMRRRIDKFTVTPIQKEGNTCRHRIEMWIVYIPQWSLTTKVYRTAFDVTTVKHKSQWWVLDGEFKPPIQVSSAPKAKFPMARVVSGL